MANLRRRLDRERIRYDVWRLRWALERSRHGIGAGDAANVGEYLCEVAARGLRLAAANSHSHPAGWTPEAWVSAMIRAADAFDEWLNAKSAFTQTDAPAEREALQLRQRVALARAKREWRWVADNIDDLWD